MTPNSGSHALRRRCPSCGKKRRFYEPPGDQGGKRYARIMRWHAVVEGLGFKVDKARASWINTPFGWCCVHCAIRFQGG